MRTRFLSPDDERWAAWTRSHPCDIYQHPNYLRAASLHESGEPVAFFAENDDGALLIPLLLRDIPGTDRQDVTSPYGYPAPVWSASNPASHLSAFVDTLHERRIVSAFLRLHPLLPGPDRHVRRDATGHSVYTHKVKHGPTVWLSRTAPEDESLEHTRSGHVSDIQRLLREGYRVELLRPDAPGAMDVFCEIYTATMDRVKASSFYYFSRAYFDMWKDGLADYADLAFVRNTRGDLAAAGLFTRHQRWMQFHLSGTAAAHRSYAPTKLMLHRMRDAEWTEAQRRQTSVDAPSGDEPAILHLGGGLNAATDSLFYFKSGFSNRRATFSTWRIICDPRVYASLSSQVAGPLTTGQHDSKESVGSDQAAEVDPATIGLTGGFFPAYRR